jgi:hypothetical protein
MQLIFMPLLRAIKKETARDIGVEVAAEMQGPAEDIKGEEIGGGQSRISTPTNGS